MKNKILKSSIILLIILTMTMANFIFVGRGLISYAEDNISTNHQNVEFKAYFKDKDGKEVSKLEKHRGEEEDFLYLHINVKNEGYFNGEVSLKDSNFTLKESDSTYVNKIENNTIYLNQINVGTTEEIKVKIEPITEETFEIGLLNVESKINLKGIYRDSKEKNINIKTTRNLSLVFVEDNKEENVINEMKVITNKVMEIDGVAKRIVQLSYNMGLKENNYPMKEISSKIAIPTVNEKQAEIVSVEYLNNMTSFDYNYDGNNIDLTLKNPVNEQGKALWKTQGNEEVILTLIYDEDVKLEDTEIALQEKVVLYNDKEISVDNKVTVTEEELDSAIQIDSKNSEEEIYKGKMYSGIPRKYESTTYLSVNYAKAINNVELVEDEDNYKIGDSYIKANVTYNETVIKKEAFDKMFGENGVLTIYDQEEKVIGTIDNKTKANEQGDIVISYEGKNVSKITIKATNPVEEGTIELNNIKTIVETGDTVKNAQELTTKVVAKYNEDIKQEKEVSIKLEDTVTEAKLEVNKNSLSTVISNNVEMKAVLLSNNEKYDLYKNPKIAIELPQQVENITINSVDILYESELKIKDYTVNGRIINITLDGEQTQYKENAVEGSVIVINATLDVNKKSATSDSEIKMTYSNDKKVTYASGENGIVSKEIRIVAPKEVTTIYSVKDLNVETIGQEDIKEIMMDKGSDEKNLGAQIEIINNNENAIENVRVLGDLPTNDNENNMNIEIVKGITVQGAENVKVYYSENSQATDDIENESNGWTETIEDNNKVNKYLIVAEQIPAQSSIQGEYIYKIPAGLEYNQVAKTGYSVKNVNSETGVESEVPSTVIEMQTGIGPNLDVKLNAEKGSQKIEGPVKNGEVIKYNIEVLNTGTEDVSNVTVKGQVPEGTTMVVPEEYYEYTGATYYKELDSRNYETTIENLKVGDVANISYEVRVNSNISAGTKLNNTAQIIYGDNVTKQSNEIQNETSKGDIRVSVKRITDRSIELYHSVKYYAIVENISNEKQENVEVETNLSDNISVDSLALITGMESREINRDDLYIEEEDEGKEPNNVETETVEEVNPQEIERQELEYNKVLNIGDIEPGRNKVLIYSMSIDQAKSNKPITFSVVAKDNGEKYQSNVWQDNIKGVEVGLSMTTNTQEQYVKTGDVIEYTIVAQNKSDLGVDNLFIEDEIPSQLSINKITVDGKELEDVDLEQNNVFTILELEGNGSSTIKIETVVDYAKNRNSAEVISNSATVEYNGITLATTETINHIIQTDEDEQDPDENGGNEQNGGNNGNNNNIDDNNVAKGNKIITGAAWLDENANGQKENGEKLLSNIKVKLLNAETNSLVKGQNGEALEATTNENGIYVLDKIGNGKYIVIFEYDPQYGLTKYKAEGINETQNSDALLNELLIENDKKEVASTDIIEINNNNISDINIGLIKLQNFDLKLDKYVNRILIQNAKGTTVREYDNANIAKAEIEGKYLNGSTVIIEYKINITNNGEVVGYAKKIADYAPSDLKFSSELNKSWYQVGNTLYSEELANDKIKPGETKTLILTLTKTMTENNTGSIANIAEIVEDYNELGIKDSNSTPGNRVKTENDYGLAEVIISIKTGGIVYVGIIIAVVAVLGVTAVIIIIKKRNKTEGNI